MSEPGNNAAMRDPAGRLSEAIREVKNAAADRADVVVDLRDAERMRLELLVSELQPVFADVPHEIDVFDFTVSSGLQPRLWIDATSHIAMGRDKRTYRFVRDTRAGRIVLAESSDMKPVADQVTRYIAERLVERQRLLDGVPESVALLKDAAPLELTRNGNHLGWQGFLTGLYLVCSGVLLAVFAALIYLLWNRIDVLLQALPNL